MPASPRSRITRSPIQRTSSILRTSRGSAISCAAAIRPRILSCSSSSACGQGKTISSGISPRKSDFAKDEASSVRSSVVAASIPRLSLPGLTSRRPARIAVMEWFEEDDSRDGRLAARRRHQREVTYRRRRLGAVAIFVVVVIAFVLLASGDLDVGGGGGPFTAPQEAAKPVKFI